VSIALYRRFRPEAFNEVIGQEQVTVPLMAALRAGKINHAYLFSGPRGCGKTTSARILARTLNCAENTEANPLDTPCGKCESCVELSRLGAGSLDVVEIDAASHGGVDAARDLRERATFTPSRDRFKIFIIDEAHMVTKEGFNALLKVVEEPPPHIKFIFATTEPDKVLGTIRSRTHHYPFRLVPSEILSPYLENLVALEGASLGPGVVPLVIRAGGGSVRDSLSVLDQLIAGSPDGSVSAERAVALLGYTPAAMLDEAVEALASHDGAALFQVIDRVIENGNPPQRFAEDLLQRFRDLIVVSVTGDGAAAVFRDWPVDELAAAKAQAALFDLGTMTRLGETISSGLSTMVGATSPRLQLELLCARLLVPLGPEQLAARLANLENSLATGQIPVVAPSVAGRPSPQGQGSAAPGGAGVVHHSVAEVQVMSPRARAAAKAETADQPVVPPPIAAPFVAAPPVSAPVVASSPVASAPGMSSPTVSSAVASTQGASQAATSTSVTPPPVTPEVSEPQPDSTVAPVQATAGSGPASAPGELEKLQSDWAELVASIPSPVTRSLLISSAGPVGINGNTVSIGFEHQTLAARLSDPRQADPVGLVLSEKLGRSVKAEGVVAGASGTLTRLRDSASAASHAGSLAQNDVEGRSASSVRAWNDRSGRSVSSGQSENDGNHRPVSSTHSDYDGGSGSRTPVQYVKVGDSRVTGTGVSDPNELGTSPAEVDESWREADAAWLAGESIPLKVPAAPEPEPRPATQRGLDSAPGSTRAGSPAQDDGSHTVTGGIAYDHGGEKAHNEAVPESAAASSVEKPRLSNVRTAASEDEADPDDAEVEQDFMSGLPLVLDMLGGTIVSEEAL